jgi:hypothetical protein
MRKSEYLGGARNAVSSNKTMLLSFHGEAQDAMSAFHPLRTFVISLV